MTTYGVGIIGTGFGINVQLPGFAAHPSFEVVAVTSGTPGRAASLAAEQGIAHAHEDWRELVTNPDVQLVSVASTTDRHASQTLAALEAGKSVLCEKPMGLNAEQTRAMVAAAQAAGTTAAIDFLWRHRPAEAMVKQLIMSGQLGEPRHVGWSIVWPGLPLWARPMSWSWQASRGGGMLGNVGSHWLDFLLWCFGPVTHASGQLVSHFPTRTWPDGSNGTVDTEDAFTVQLRFERGGVGTLRFFAAAHHSPGSRLEAYGSEGSIVLEDDKELLAGKVGEPLKPMPLPAFRVPSVSKAMHAVLAGYAPFLAVVDRLARRLDGEDVRDLATFVDGSRVQTVMDAVRRSNEGDGGWVEVESAV